MDESLTQQRRVSDEGLRVVKLCWMGKKSRKGLMVPFEEAPAKYVPAAAVIRMVQALFGITGRKGSVDGIVS